MYFFDWLGYTAKRMVADLYQKNNMMMWTTENMPDQSGKTALVTGANSGIGYEIALALYKKGADVIIAARDQSAAMDAMQKMIDEGGTGTLETALLDLASLKQVAEFALQFKANHSRLDLLINNAGIMTPPQSVTNEGFELQFGVNFLGHYALTGHLYPVLKNTPGARVVTMSSGAYKSVEGIDFDNIRSENSYEANREYGISKLAGLLFMAELQLRSNLLGDDIISTAAHPGVTATNLSRHMDEAVYNAAVEQFGTLMPAWQGALPALYAATSAKVTGNDYYGPDGEHELKGYPAPAVLNEAARDVDAAAKLWDYAEKVTGISFPAIFASY